MRAAADEPGVDADSNLTVAVLVGLGLSLFGGPLLGQLPLPRWIPSSATGTLLTNSLYSWVLVGVLLALVVDWEQRGVSSIGLRRPSPSAVAVGIGAGLGGTVVALVLTGVAVVVLNLQQPETLTVISQLSLPAKLVIVATAVVTEEILWRGYPIERLTELTGTVWIGASVSGIVFLAVHFPSWGLVGAIPQTVFTLVLVSVYVWSRNVVVAMLTHGVINVLMLIVLPAFL